jgi:hypothetical protein
VCIREHINAEILQPALRVLCRRNSFVPGHSTGCLLTGLEGATDIEASATSTQQLDREEDENSNHPDAAASPSDRDRKASAAEPAAAAGAALVDHIAVSDPAPLHAGSLICSEASGIR